MSKVNSFVTLLALVERKRRATMKKYLVAMCKIFTVAGLVTVTVPAQAFFSADVSGYTDAFPGQYNRIMWDWDPGAAPGRTVDDMSFDLGDGWKGAGYADTAKGKIGLYASKHTGFNQTSTKGEIVDTYTLVDTKSSVSGTPIPGLYATVTYAGFFSRTTSVSDLFGGDMFGSFTLIGTGGQAVFHGYSYDPTSWSGSITFFFTASNGIPITGNLGLNVGVGGGDTPEDSSLYGDYLNDLSITFGSTDPSVALQVTSEGGYLQMPSSVPEPSTIALFLSGVATLSLVAKARRKRN